MFSIHSKRAFLLGVGGCIFIVAPDGLPQKSTQGSDAVQEHVRHVERGLNPALIGGVVVSNSSPRSIQQRMLELHIPGVSIAVIHDGRIEWSKGYGVTRIGGPPVTSETLFQAASISKPVAAMAALTLVQQGKLTLDGDVNAQLVSWKIPESTSAHGKPVTLRELLTHTGGIGVHGFPGYGACAPVPTLAEVLDGRTPSNTPPIRIESTPGEEWKYSGGGYTIAQQLIVDVSHREFPAFMRATVLDPMAMSLSSYEEPLPASSPYLAAMPFDSRGTPIPGGAHTYPELAAAGLWTTPSDLARLALGITASLKGQTGPVLSGEMTREMLKPGLGDWGLGWEIGGSSKNPFFTHTGSNAGFQSVLLVYETGEDGVVIMTNSDNGGILIDEILRSISAEYGWNAYRSIVLLAPETILLLAICFVILIGSCLFIGRVVRRWLLSIRKRPA